MLCAYRYRCRIRQCESTPIRRAPSLGRFVDERECKRKLNLRPRLDLIVCLSSVVGIDEKDWQKLQQQSNIRKRKSTLQASDGAEQMLQLPVLTAINSDNFMPWNLLYLVETSVLLTHSYFSRFLLFFANCKRTTKQTQKRKDINWNKHATKKETLKELAGVFFTSFPRDFGSSSSIQTRKLNFYTSWHWGTSQARRKCLEGWKAWLAAQLLVSTLCMVRQRSDALSDSSWQSRKTCVFGVAFHWTRV